MWTMSNFPDRWPGILALFFGGLFVLLIAGCSTYSFSTDQAPDAPRPMAQEAVQPSTEMVVRPKKETDQPILLSVIVKPISALPADLARNVVLAKKADFVVIEVQTSMSFAAPPQTSSPVLVVNGRRVDNTFIHPEDEYRLIGLMDGKKLKATENRVQIDWIGARQSPFEDQSLKFK